MFKKKASKLVLLFSVLGIAFSVFFCPVSSLPVQAASGEEFGIQPLHDDIRYRLTVMDNKLYKRLFNYSIGEWIGDWIYVCDIEP